MHQTTPHPPVLSSQKAGFSLVEVTLAIGIIAFAFIALFSLLPTGLNVYRASIDSANEMWIAQNLNSMLQTSDWEDTVDSLGKDEYFFDGEGRFTDTNLKPAADADVRLRRLYIVKAVVQDAFRPDKNSTGNSVDSETAVIGAKRVAILMAPLAEADPWVIRPDAMKDYEKIKADLEAGKEEIELPVGTKLRMRTILIARMDNEVK